MQNKLKRKMAHLILASEGSEMAESHMELGSEEQRPLLRAEGDASGRRSTGVPTNYSLIPDASLPAQVRRPSATAFITVATDSSTLLKL